MAAVFLQSPAGESHSCAAPCPSCHSAEAAKPGASGIVQIQTSLLPEGTQLPGNVLPLLHEIAAKLEDFLLTGRESSIDLRRAPFVPGDFEALQKFLNQGEVVAQVNSLGPTRIRETSISGVWWITHCNQEDEVVGEFIEITACPEMLKTPAEDARASLSQLRAKLALEVRVVNPTDVMRSLQALGAERGEMVNGAVALSKVSGDSVV